MTDSDDDKFLRGVKNAWQEQEDGLDSDTLRELRLRRYAALEAAQSKPLSKPLSKLTNWLPIGGSAIAAAFALAIVLWPPAQVADIENLQFEDAEILASAEELELLEELDFYAWLEAEGYQEIESTRG